MIWEKPKFDKHGFTQFGWQVRTPEKLELGKKVKIGAFTKLDCLHGIKIGDNTDIAPNCHIVSFSSDYGKKGKVVIGKNVYMGTFALIMPNVRIGDNAKIGAFSMVAKNVPKNEVWFGIPAKKEASKKNE